MICYVQPPGQLFPLCWAQGCDQCCIDVFCLQHRVLQLLSMVVQHLKPFLQANPPFENDIIVSAELGPEGATLDHASSTAKSY